MARSAWIASVLALFVLTNVVRFAVNERRHTAAQAVHEQGPSFVRTAHVASSKDPPRNDKDDDWFLSYTKVAALEDRINELTAYVDRVLNETRHRQHPPGDGDFHLLPQCDELMRRPNSPFRDGVFLASHATKIQWVPRADGSRQLELREICRLKRYTSQEANQCLAGKHLSMIGDSLTRYQFTSLAYFLENGHFQSRFGRPPSTNDPCTHVDEAGRPTCASFAEPSVTNSDEWEGEWNGFFRGMGGGDDGGIMNGRMEAASARAASAWGGQDADNFLYAGAASRDDGGDRVVLSYAFEAGWGDDPRPLQGYFYTNCSYTGSCRKTKETMEELESRSLAKDFDWQQSFPEAIYRNGTLRTVLPRRPDYLIYNRGHWGRLSDARARLIMPALHDWVAGDDDEGESAAGDSSASGDESQDKDVGAGDDSQQPSPDRRCLYKTTNAGADSMRGGYRQEELQKVWPHVYAAGCSYFDAGYLTDGFSGLNFDDHMRNERSTERRSIFTDSVHFQPWVYEELNQVLLNVLCNTKNLSS